MAISTTVTAQLGSAALYAFLGYSGVTNSDGASTIVNNGLIGSYATNSITAGSPAWTLTGDAAVVVATAANQVDLGNAIVFFQGLSSTPISAGYASQTFTATAGGFAGAPGFVGAASSSLLFSGGTIVLDGAGYTNPVFVFTAASTITFSTAATTISLINGALPQNVVFLAGSSLTSDAHNHVLVGNLIGASSVTVNSSTLGTLTGRLLAHTGLVTISNPVVFTLPAGAPVPGALAAATIAVAPYPVGVDNTQRNEWLRGYITISAGTYPAVVSGSPATTQNGIPLNWGGQSSLYALPVPPTSTIGTYVPIDVNVKSVSNPPSGYIYQVDYTTGDLHIYQSAGALAPLTEITGTVPTAVLLDSIFFCAVFTRN
jgi:hypothetical protein